MRGRRRRSSRLPCGDRHARRNQPAGQGHRDRGRPGRRRQGRQPALPKLAEALEKAAWKKRACRRLAEGHRDTLAAGPRTTKPSHLSVPLFIHGTFSNAASAFRALAGSISLIASKTRMPIAFSPSTTSASAERRNRTPDAARGLPEQVTTFDVVTRPRWSRSALPRRARGQLGDLARRFKLDRAVLVASPNEGTPRRRRNGGMTIGWMANLLRCSPTTRLQRVGRSSPTDWSGWPIMRWAIFQACVRWTPTES